MAHECGVVTSLFRYPVKGLSAEPLDSVPVSEGVGFPLDRHFALALSKTPFSASEPKAFPKINFLMLMRDEALAGLSTSFDEKTNRLTVSARDGSVLIAADLESSEGRAEVENFFVAFAPASDSGNPRLVNAPGHRFTDVGGVSWEHMEAISLINLASVRNLEEASKQPLHPLRFRANIYIDGIPPWDERNWLEHELQIGPVKFRCIRRTRRCPAINVNPETAQRDADLPRTLIKDFGHPDMGVYLSALNDGHLAVGQSVVQPV